MAAIWLGAAIVYLILAAPQYSATSRLIIDTRGARVLNIDEVLPALNSEISTIESQVEILRSRRIAEQVLAGQSGVETPVLQPGAAAKAGPPVEEKILRELMRRITVERKGLSNVIDVSYRDEDRLAAARTVNALVDAYLADLLEVKHKATRVASEWLRARAAETSAQVRLAEGRVQSYRARHGLVESGEMQLGRREIADHTLQLTAARARAAEAKARLQQVEELDRSPERLPAIGKALDSTVIVDLRRQQAEIQRRISNLVSRLGEGHPSIADARAELDTLTRDLAQEVGRLVANARNDFELTTRQVSILEQELERLKRQHAERDLLAIGLGELERDAEAIRQLHTSLLKRLKETQAQESLQITDARVIAYAAPPLHSSSPRALPTLAFALLGGLLTGALAAFVRARYAPVLGEPKDVEHHVGVQTVAALPAAKAPRRASSRESPGGAPAPLIPLLADPAYVQAALALQLWLDGVREDCASCVVLIASAVQGEGKTTIAVTLADQAARRGARTLLVDLDLRSAALSSRLAPGASRSLIYLVREDGNVRDIGDVIIRVREPALDLLPAAKAGDDLIAFDVLASRRLAALIDRLRGAYELIILDAPALLASPGAIALFRHANAAVLVVRAETTSPEVVRSAVERADAPAGCRLVAALNMTRRSSRDRLD